MKVCSEAEQLFKTTYPMRHDVAKVVHAELGTVPLATMSLDEREQRVRKTLRKLLPIMVDEVTV